MGRKLEHRVKKHVNCSAQNLKNLDTRNAVTPVSDHKEGHMATGNRPENWKLEKGGHGEWTCVQRDARREKKKCGLTSPRKTGGGEAQKHIRSFGYSCVEQSL